MSDDKAAFEDLIVGTWAPVEGNPADLTEYRADGTVQMAMFGGVFHMNGIYRFIEPEVVELAWGNSASWQEAESVVSAVNSALQADGAEITVGIVRRSVLQVAVTADQLWTFHLEKGRSGHFYRVIDAAGSTTQY